MAQVLAGLLAFAALVFLLGALSYNRFVEQRQLAENSFSNIDTELRRRYDLIPNLVETVRGYAAHEQAVMAEVIEARGRAIGSTGSPQSQAADENVLVGSIKHLFAVAERYPDLKADEHFRDLQAQLIDTEDRIQAARRFYNANVRDFNRRVESIPSNIVAALFGFGRLEYFEVEPAAAAVPDASF